MINTVWESRVCQLDMQLIGKAVLSAAALLLLGLAYRFYKFRALERSEEPDKHGPSFGSLEGDVLDSPQRDYEEDESSNLRFRRVHSNLQNGLVTDPGRKPFADSVLSTHEVHVTAQEGFETADSICKYQNDYDREVTEELHNIFNPLQSHLHGDDPTSQSKFDGEETVNKSKSKHCREDPEGREMLEKLDLVKDHSEQDTKKIAALSSIALSVSHQNETKLELHRFCSTAEVHMQESIMAEDENTLQTLVPGGLRGKIYDYHIESTSQSVTAVNTSKPVDNSKPWNTSKSGDNSPQPSLSNILHLATSEEEQETYTGPTVLVETIEEKTKGDDLNQLTKVHNQHLTNDSIMMTDESTDIGENTQKIRSDSYLAAISQQVSEEGASNIELCTSQSKFTYVKKDLQILEENEAIKSSIQNTAHNVSIKTPDQIDPILEEISSDIHKDQKEESHATGSSSFVPVNVTASFLNTVDQTIETASSKQTGPGTYHVSLTPESVFDIHIDLSNCYEVLCLAKKNNLETLKTAAYKVMSNDYLEVLQNPSIYGLLNVTERDLILEGRMKGRRFVVVADIDTQATSETQNESNLSYYDNESDVWNHLANIPAEAVSRGSSMATMFNYLFVVLGCDGPGRQIKPSRRVLYYNPITDNWKEISPLNDARPHCKLVALDGFLYAIGGECLHTVEMYDPRQNRWTYVAPLPNDTFAVAHMATAYDDEIFVTGGTFRYMLLRYREREKVWKSSIVSGSKDRTTEMVASNNFLYRFDLNRSRGISVHRCNIRARIWYECATYAMPYPAPFQCAVINNNIYCISRNFNMRFLAEDISPRFMDTNLQPVPSPKGVLYPLVLVLPVEGSH